ncbi:MAG: HEPN domain-containing protein [Planctomycetaceae bacterium]|jgi:HEPN domain-containing protein|nr:HEPN domain-containing protein [Planctomycetaceae bacterium]
MEPAKRDYLNNWLIKANEDVAVIQELLSREPERYTSAICFHAQQAVEKFLKSYLIYFDVDFQKVHDVDYLLNECKKIDKTLFDEIDLRSLTDYGVSVRYPDDFMIPFLEDTKYYSEVALRVKQIVEKKICNISVEFS